MMELHCQNILFCANSRPTLYRTTFPTEHHRPPILPQCSLSLFRTDRALSFHFFFEFLLTQKLQAYQVLLQCCVTCFETGLVGSVEGAEIQRALQLSSSSRCPVRLQTIRRYLLLPQSPHTDTLDQLQMTTQREKARERERERAGS